MVEPVSMSDRNRGILIPIVISILAFIGWCVFILWYTLFLSSDFSLFQNIVVGLISLIIAGGFIGLMWVIWGFRAAGWRMRPAGFPAVTSTGFSSTANRSI